MTALSLKTRPIECEMEIPWAVEISRNGHLVTEFDVTLHIHAWFPPNDGFGFEVTAIESPYGALVKRPKLEGNDALWTALFDSLDLFNRKLEERVLAAWKAM